MIYFHGHCSQIGSSKTWKGYPCGLLGVEKQEVPAKGSRGGAGASAVGDGHLRSVWWSDFNGVAKDVERRWERSGGTYSEVHLLANLLSSFIMEATDMSTYLNLVSLFTHIWITKCCGPPMGGPEIIYVRECKSFWEVPVFHYEQHHLLIRTCKSFWEVPVYFFVVILLPKRMNLVVHCGA